ncbi:uncharacterized protein LOC144884727 [Branchiostoma floridae x Branchiostoma japonicum]
MVPKDKYNTRQNHEYSSPKEADLHRPGEGRRSLLYNKVEIPIETPDNHKDVSKDQDADKEREKLISEFLRKTRALQNGETLWTPATIETMMESPQTAPTTIMWHVRQSSLKNYIIPNSDVPGSKKDNRMSHNLGNNVLLICNTNDAKSNDNVFLNCDWRDNATQIPLQKDQPQSDLLKEEEWVEIGPHPNKSSYQGKKHKEEHRDITKSSRHTEGMPNKTFDQYTFIRLPKRQREGSSAKIRDRIANWRAQVVISGSPSHPDQDVGESTITKGYQNITPFIEDQGQHSIDQSMTVPEECHKDDEDQEYRARLNKAYRTNFCEEAADLFIRTMELGRWDDIVSQLNFTKSKADQLLNDSVSALKQRASGAFDSYPHDTSPPETLFRLQEDLVREAVLVLAKQCREQNARSPQVFQKK